MPLIEMAIESHFRGLGASRGVIPKRLAQIKRGKLELWNANILRWEHTIMVSVLIGATW